MLKQTRFLLPEEAIPTSWYNLAADLPKPPPPVLHPGTHQPIGPDDLAPLFPMAVIGQEVSHRALHSDPGGSARRLPVVAADALVPGAPARAGIGPARERAHLLQVRGRQPRRVPQAEHRGAAGVLRQARGREADRHRDGGRAVGQRPGVGRLAVRSGDQGLHGQDLLRAEAVPASADGDLGRAVRRLARARTPTPAATILAQDPDSNGSLGIAISEAVEDAATREDTKYALGSVLNHVLLHQTVIGQEAQQQLEMADAYPDVVIGCVGGGSNFAGISFPFVRQKLAGKPIRIVAAEPAACPTLTRGTYAYDFGDTGQLTPLVKMHTLGHTFVPAGIHAGGLRYHGAAPLVSMLLDEGLIEATAIKQRAAFEAAVLFGRTEGIVPAPEPSHAIRVAIDEAMQAREAGEARTILFNLCGHGFFDLSAYDSYLSGSMQDYEHPQSEIEAALAGLPSVAE